MLKARYINAGAMDERVTIESYTESRSTAGGVNQTWATHHTCWAERNAKGGSEKYEADQLTAVNKVLWRIRYKSTVTEKMRIKDRNDDYFYIIAVDLDGRDQWMLLTTEKRD